MNSLFCRSVADHTIVLFLNFPASKPFKAQGCIIGNL